MASPRLEVFFVFNETTGAPIPGIVASMSFDTYKKDDGTNVTPPSFNEVGGGAYSFLPVFADTTHGIAYCVNTGGGVITPKRITRFMRPEDWNDDDAVILSSSIANISGAVNFTRNSIPTLSGALDTIRKVEVGRRKIAANKITYYDDDDTTPFIIFDLKDASGNACTTGSFERVPE